MAMPTLAYADEEDSEHISTGTVEVTATRSVKDIMEVPMSVSVITAEQIERMPAANLKELLRNIPGVNATVFGNGNDPNYNSVGIRGNGAGYTLILVDGQKRSDLNSSVNPVEFSIDPSMIERIEIIKGPASVLYGSEAMGGVINIITKKGGKNAIQASVRTSYISKTEGLNSSISLYGTAYNVDYRISASRNNAEKYQWYHTMYDGVKDHNHNFNTYLAYTFTDNLSAGIIYDDYKAETSYRYLNTSFRDSLTQANWEAYGPDFVKDTKKYAAFVEAKQLSDFLSRLRLDFFYQNYEKTSIIHDTGYLSYVSPTDSYGGTMQADIPIQDHTFAIFGYDFLHEEIDYNSYYTSDFYPDIIGNLRGIRNGEQDTHAAFISVEHYLPANLTVNYGARYTHVTTTLNNYTQANISGTTIATRNPDEYSESHPVFNAGVVWTGIDDLALRATWAQGFKVPTFYSRYLSGGSSTSTNVYTKNNPDLKPETSDTFELGARYSTDFIDADAVVYYTKLKDSLTSMTTGRYVDEDGNEGGSFTEYISINDGWEEKWGIEATVNLHITPEISPYISGSFIQRETKSTNITNSGVPTYTGKMGVRYNTNLGEKHALSTDLNIAGQSETKSNYDSIYCTGGVCTEQVDGFATVNLSTGVSFKEHDAYIVVDLNNILDTKYQTREGYPYEAGFNFAIVGGMNF